MADPRAVDRNTHDWVLAEINALRQPPSERMSSLFIDSAAPPADPFDGMVWRYRGNLGDAGLFTWLFMYDGADTPYRWHFVGGATLADCLPAGPESTSSAAVVDLGTDGPTLTMPFAGVYVASYGAQMRSDLTGTNSDRAIMHLYANAASVDSITQQGTDRSLSPTQLQAASGCQMVTLAGAGQIIKCRYQAEGSGSFFSNRWLTVDPVKVA